MLTLIARILGLGNVVSVPNENRKWGQAFFYLHVNVVAEGKPITLLLTPNEFAAAKHRSTAHASN